MIYWQCSESAPRSCLRLLLGLVFVIGVAEAALAGIGVFPDKYDWILRLYAVRNRAGLG